MKNYYTTQLVIFLYCLLSTHQILANEILLPDMGASSSITLSADMEKKIAHSVINQLQNSYGLIDDLEINEYLSNLGYSLVEQTEDSMFAFNFFLLNSHQINAFATPGGVVAVYSGLFLTTDSESELASVIGHEIAHVTQNHIARAFEKASQMNLPMTLGLVAAIILGASGAPDAGLAAATGIQALGAQSQIDITRANEKEADRVGIKYLYKANFNPYGMPEFFQKLHQKNRYAGDKYPEFLRTHPVTINRISESQQRADLYHKKTTFIKSEKNYLFMKGKLLALTTKNITQLEKYYKQLSDSNSLAKHPEYKYIYAQLLQKNNKNKQAIKEFKQLYEFDKNNIYALTAYAMALLSSQPKENKKYSLLLLKKALQQRPFDRVLSAYYAQALIEMGYITKSIELIKEYNQYAVKRAEFYELLSRAYGKQGNLLKAHTALAENYYLKGLYKQAIMQISLAKKQAKKQAGDNFYSLSRLDSKLLEIKQEQEKYKMEK